MNPRAASLPMNPWAFVPLYLFLGFSGFILQGLGSLLTAYLALAAVLSAFYLHIHWSLKSVRFAVAQSEEDVSTRDVISTSLRPLKNALVCASIPVALVLLYATLSTVMKQPFAPLYWQLLAALLILLSFAFLLRMFWLAATTFCEQETGTEVAAHSVLGTFLMFVYLVVGAPFLFARLKAIENSHGGVAPSAP